jgi:hypothetical protein
VGCRAAHVGVEPLQLGALDDRVLVVAQHVLHLLGPLDVALHAARPEISGELRRIPGTLHRLAHLVQVGVARIPWEPANLLPRPPVCAPGRSAQRPVACEVGIRDGQLEPVQQADVPGRRELLPQVLHRP